MKIMDILFNSIKKRGLKNTFQFAFYDYMFDKIYKVNTKGLIELEDLHTVGNKENSIQYQASNYFLLNKFFKKYGNIIQGKTLVDFGSGKGRVLLLGMEHKAKKCIGVEFAKELIDICDNNLHMYKKKKNLDTEYEIILDDALNYEFSGNEDIFFFYNPFNDVVLSDIAQKIASLKKDTIIVYINPVYKNVFETDFHEVDNFNNEVIIYSNKKDIILE